MSDERMDVIRLDPGTPLPPRLTSERNFALLGLFPQREMNTLLASILDHAHDMVGAERCSLFFVDHDRQELWTKVATDSNGTIKVRPGQRPPSLRGRVSCVAFRGRFCIFFRCNPLSRFTHSASGSHRAWLECRGLRQSILFSVRGIHALHAPRDSASVAISCALVVNLESMVAGLDTRTSLPLDSEASISVR